MTRADPNRLKAVSPLRFPSAHAMDNWTTIEDHHNFTTPYPLQAMTRQRKRNDDKEESPLPKTASAAPEGLKNWDEIPSWQQDNEYILSGYRIPEKLRPYKYDILGSSHQILHLAVILAALAHMFAQICFLASARLKRGSEEARKHASALINNAGAKKGRPMKALKRPQLIPRAKSLLRRDD
ncbi:MAG: hypothetical protein Q9184_003845 [Pyrenodesmia sp. 2 TL-2023]